MENSDGWHLLCINCRYITKCRVNLAIKYLVQAIGSSSHSNERGFGINISKELTLASQGNIESKAIKRKDEVERIAVSAR